MFFRLALSSCASNTSSVSTPKMLRCRCIHTRCYFPTVRFLWNLPMVGGRGRLMERLECSLAALLRLVCVCVCVCVCVGGCVGVWVWHHENGGLENGHLLRRPENPYAYTGCCSRIKMSNGVFVCIILWNSHQQKASLTVRTGLDHRSSCEHHTVVVIRLQPSLTTLWVWLASHRAPISLMTFVQRGSRGLGYIVTSKPSTSFTSQSTCLWLFKVSFLEVHVKL